MQFGMLFHVPVRIIATATLTPELPTRAGVESFRLRIQTILAYDEPAPAACTLTHPFPIPRRGHWIGVLGSRLFRAAEIDLLRDTCSQAERSIFVY